MRLDAAGTVSVLPPNTDSSPGPSPSAGPESAAQHRRVRSSDQESEKPDVEVEVDDVEEQNLFDVVDLPSEGQDRRFLKTLCVALPVVALVQAAHDQVPQTHGAESHLKRRASPRAEDVPPSGRTFAARQQQATAT